MKILAIETSTEACSAALLYNGDIEEQFQIAPRSHGDLILNMVDLLLANAQLKPQQLDAIAFGRGPGAFTGVRIATSVTQGIAFGADLPVVPVSTLEIVAQGSYRQHGYQNALCAMDARMGEIYFAAYAKEGDAFKCVTDEQVCKPEDVAPVDDNISWAGVGSGWGIYSDVLSRRVSVDVNRLDASALPRAMDAVVLAEQCYQAGKTVSAEEALPVYLRDNVVSKPGIQKRRI